MLPRLSNTHLALFVIAIGLTFIACAALALVGFEYWWRGTPPYSLAQIGRAVQTHDLQLFRKHVDLRSVANRMIDDAIVRNKGAADYALGQGMVELLRPRIVESFEAQIERFVETGQFPDDANKEGVSAKELNERIGKNIGPVAFTEIDGKVARVGLTITPEDTKKPIIIDLKMRQTPDGYWQLMEVDLTKLPRPTSR